MLIISVTDNENNRWKRNIEKKQRQKRTNGAKATMKGWELNNFYVRVICKAFLISKSYWELTFSIISKKGE